MRRLLVLVAAGFAAAFASGPAAAGTSSSVAALQVALRAHGHYPATVDGVDGPLTRAGLTTFQKRTGLPANGTLGPATRSAFGALGRPLLGQRELGVGAVGWDVSSLEFRLVPFGLGSERRRRPFHRRDGQGTRTLPVQEGPHRRRHRRQADVQGARRRQRSSCFAPPVRAVHTVHDGDSFFSIAERYGVSPLLLAKENGLALAAVIVPGQKLALPAGAQAPTIAAVAAGSATRDAVRASIDHWSAAYGVDPQLARATAWMESGFQENVVSNVGALGVMQLLPGTWQWVDQVLLGTTTPRTYDGNIRAGVRYLRWLLDEFDGNRRLALAGYYQGAQAVRDRGLFDDTKQYVTVILKLYGTV